MTDWKCSECGIDAAAARSRRRRLHLAPLHRMAKTCSVPCARERERRTLRDKYGRGSGYKPPLPPGWRCTVCGCGAAAAYRKRDRRGLAALSSPAKTCSPECAAVLHAQNLALARDARVRRAHERRRDPNVLARRAALSRVGARLRELRRERGFTQLELAKLVGLRRSYISNVERGQFAPRKDVLGRLGPVLKTSVKALRG